ncbi:MAG: STAS domain-containing protein [Candidatus Polarisedimenticolaceae bacterium]|nr:STAS domain-containing protein [Candidatus Polarisedimenticolaceae bacterium]
MFSLSQYMTARSIYPVAALCADILQSTDKIIYLDASQVSFVDPTGLCLLAAICKQLTEEERRVELVNIDLNLEGYLARMDLFRECGIEYKECFTRQNQAHSLVELRRIDERNEVNGVSNRIARSIVGSMPDYNPNSEPDEMTGFRHLEQTEQSLSYMFTELLENALTHGRRAGYINASVWVCSQYYRSSKLIRIGVVDNGCGLLASLRNNSETELNNHYDAVRNALIPGVTCNRELGLDGFDSVNQGLGLSVIDRIIQLTGGRALYASGDAAIEKVRDNARHSDIPAWNGTIIGIEVPRDRVNELSLSTVISEFRVQDAGISPAFI